MRRLPSGRPCRCDRIKDDGDDIRATNCRPRPPREVDRSFTVRGPHRTLRCESGYGVGDNDGYERGQVD